MTARYQWCMCEGCVCEGCVCDDKLFEVDVEDT